MDYVAEERGGTDAYNPVDDSSREYTPDGYIAMSPAMRLAAVEPLEQGTHDPSAPRIGTSEHVRTLEYAGVVTGKFPVDIAPIDRPADPVRRGENPARRPFSRFVFQTAPWFEEIIGFFAQGERGLGLERPTVPSLGADMPIGLMIANEEHRRLYDGSHA